MCLLFLILGVGMGVFWGHQTPMKICKKSIELPRNHTSTIILLFIVAKYIVGYLQAVNLNSHALIIDIAISGLFSGWFLGKSTYYLYRLLKVR